MNPTTIDPRPLVVVKAAAVFGAVFGIAVPWWFGVLYLFGVV